MKFVSPLSDAEQKALTDRYRNAPTFNVRQRAQALLLSHRGYPVIRIKEILEVQHETVSRWLDRWKAEGIDGLNDREKSGRPMILSEEEVNDFVENIKDNPHQIKEAHRVLEEKTGKPVSRSTLKKILKKRNSATNVVGNPPKTGEMKHFSSRTNSSWNGLKNKKMPV